MSKAKNNKQWKIQANEIFPEHYLVFYMTISFSNSYIFPEILRNPLEFFSTTLNMYYMLYQFSAITEHYSLGTLNNGYLLQSFGDWMSNSKVLA
jgi:hypothetical protein